jgi:pyruvate dehydrogenase E1 component alpha subunit
MLGRDDVAVAFIGDGGMNRGPLLEAFNWAKVFNLPLLVVCEDNRFSYTTSTKLVTGGPGFTARAAGFGLHAETVDGNDVAQVAAITRRMIDAMRAGAGPMFLHALTYRLAGHLATDSAPYRKSEEVARHAVLDPLVRCEAWLRHFGFDDTALEQTRREVTERITVAVETAEAAPWPDEADLVSDVQDIGAPKWH